MKGKKEKMSSPLQERLIEICTDRDISMSEFSLSIGKSIAYLSSMNKDITIDVLNNILCAYPEYNIYWIVNGSLPKLKRDIPAPEPAQSTDKFIQYLIGQNEDLKKRVEDLNREIGRLESQIEGLGDGHVRLGMTAECADVPLLKSAE